MIKKLKMFIFRKKRMYYIKKYSYYRDSKYLNKYNDTVSKCGELAL